MCLACGENPVKKDSFSISYNGFSFIIRPWANLLCQDCTESYFREVFDNYNYRANGRFLVQSKGREVFVHWDEFCMRECCSDLQDPAIEILLALDIFSYNREDNWGVVEGRRVLNPGVTGALFFTRLRDVIAYAGQRFGRTRRNWEICQYGKVLSKKEALGE